MTKPSTPTVPTVPTVHDRSRRLRHRPRDDRRDAVGGDRRAVTPDKRWTDNDAGFRVLNRIHKSILRATGGRWPRTLSGMTAVELHTIGRKSGLPRSSMLTSPIHDESRVVLVASKGGNERDPLWYGNLRANPDVEVTMNGDTRAMRARTASKDEKAELVAGDRRHVQELRPVPGAVGTGHTRGDLRAPAFVSRVGPGPASGHRVHWDPPLRP